MQWVGQMYRALVGGRGGVRQGGRAPATRSARRTPSNLVTLPNPRERIHRWDGSVGVVASICTPRQPHPAPLLTSPPESYPQSLPSPAPPQAAPLQPRRTLLTSLPESWPQNLLPPGHARRPSGPPPHPTPLTSPPESCPRSLPPPAPQQAAPSWAQACARPVPHHAAPGWYCQKVQSSRPRPGSRRVQRGPARASRGRRWGGSARGGQQQWGRRLPVWRWQQGRPAASGAAAGRGRCQARRGSG